MVAAGQLGYHPAISLMHLDLAVQGMGAKHGRYVALGLITHHRDPCLVT